jgi:hypothetical protein
MLPDTIARLNPIINSGQLSEGAGQEARYSLQHEINTDMITRRKFFQDEALWLLT